MDWTARMNAAIDYIEENLAGSIDYSKAAGKAFCSTFHFQRMFLAVCGITPAEYVRRRRLTLAVAELSDDSSRVIDIALKYGYESPDAFTRAFRNMHGVTPTAAREPGVKLTAYPRISFQIQLTGENDMDYRMIETPAFNIAMVSRKFTSIGGQNLKDIPAWWEEFSKSPDCAALVALSGEKTGPITGGTMLGVCYGEEKTSEFYYGIAVELPEDASAGKFEMMEIPTTSWAVFDCLLSNFQETSAKVFRDWYTATGHEHTGGPDLEVYLDMGDVPDEEMRCQIWAPVKKD
ncbi:MAG TPA: AraC family transcriptional regulator [Dehalococcoidia bacterium]|nr:AraC family transcriptional regulator [Dehalococcoidia bacterium]